MSEEPQNRPGIEVPDQASKHCIGSKLACPSISPDLQGLEVSAGRRADRLRKWVPPQCRERQDAEVAGYETKAATPGQDHPLLQGEHGELLRAVTRHGMRQNSYNGGWNESVTSVATEI